jgi:hypothetical protein
MAKETNPKNTALESDVLKAAGNTAPPTAEEAARKAYNDVMDGQAQTGAAVVDQSKGTEAGTLHEQRVKAYGEGYVVANRKGVEQVFTRQTWKLLGGRGNQDGYTEVVATPPEIANLKKTQ